jgi:hypothetical protein
MSAVPRALDAWLLPTTWQRLRHVCDAIREDVAPGKKEKRAWKEMVRMMAPILGMSEPTLDEKLWRFNKTSVKPEHAGPYALHGYTSGPITNPMSLEEAESFIHQLLVAWLSSKICRCEPRVTGAEPRHPPTGDSVRSSMHVLVGTPLQLTAISTDRVTPLRRVRNRSILARCRI